MTGDGDDGRNGNGALPPGEDDPDDDAPLDEEEAAAGEERASEPVAEPLGAVVTRVLATLEGAERRPPAAGAEDIARGGTVFAAIGVDALDVRLDGPVARAALATADTSPSPRGAGWVRFTPRSMDRYAADRVEAWLGYAWRRAEERGGH